MPGTPSPEKRPGPDGQGGTGIPPRDRKDAAGNPPPKAEGPEPPGVYTKLLRIAALAQKAPGMAFTTLAHHIDVAFLEEAYRLTRKDAAPGIDHQTALDYAPDEETLRRNLRSLLNRAKSGSYRAPAVRRVHIPKGSGPETRPIGVPTFEDKILQRAVAMILEAIYEQDFRNCSYGFRPRRSAHQALHDLWENAMAMGGCWLVEVDIRRFFDTLDRSHLRALLQRRVRDGVILRLIGKWLNAGVLEKGQLSYPDEGTPQGGVISPLFANVYLHYVLDEWFESEIKPRLTSRAVLIRYADDFVMGFIREDDARRILEVLPKRFAKYGLTLHPTKTRLVDFRHPVPWGKDPRPKEPHGPRTFDFLGFTHHWGRSRGRNLWVVKRKTARKRLARTLKGIADWCRAHRHEPIPEQHRTLCAKMRGHYAYYCITNNQSRLHRLHQYVRRIWHKWLNRRSQRPSMPWERFVHLLERFPLPEPAIVHRI